MAGLVSVGIGDNAHYDECHKKVAVQKKIINDKRGSQCSDYK